MDARDKLHPTVKAYQIWADALKPVLTELLGPPATVELASSPTGDPSTALTALRLALALHFQAMPRTTGGT